MAENNENLPPQPGSRVIGLAMVRCSDDDRIITPKAFAGSVQRVEGSKCAVRVEQSGRELVLPVAGVGVVPPSADEAQLERVATSVRALVTGSWADLQSDYPFITEAEWEQLGAPPPSPGFRFAPVDVSRLQGAAQQAAAAGEEGGDEEAARQEPATKRILELGPGPAGLGAGTVAVSGCGAGHVRLASRLGWRLGVTTGATLRLAGGARWG